jgi:hypothetical protein
MLNVRHLIRVVTPSTLSHGIGYLRESQAKSGRPIATMFVDALVSTFLFGSSFSDYYSFGFDELKYRERNTYLTRLRNHRLNNLLNDPDKQDIYEHKNSMAQVLAKYMHRPWLDIRTATKAEFEAFVATTPVFFIKPDRGASGAGIERVHADAFESTDALYEYVSDPAKDICWIDGELPQHPVTAAMHPESLNCVRTITCTTSDGQVHEVYTLFKTGTGDNPVDNTSVLGLQVCLDTRTRRLYGPAVDHHLNTYDVHPDSGIAFEGYEIPFVDEAIAMAKEAALVVPGLRLIGWDIGITPSGPAIIEANIWTSHDQWQLRGQTPLHVGLMPIYKALVPEF